MVYGTISSSEVIEIVFIYERGISYHKVGKLKEFYFNKKSLFLVATFPCFVTYILILGGLTSPFVFLDLPILFTWKFLTEAKAAKESKDFQAITDC